MLLSPIDVSLSPFLPLSLRAMKKMFPGEGEKETCTLNGDLASATIPEKSRLMPPPSTKKYELEDPLSSFSS